jgi:uncharacterized protein YggU (UPF0235/DUF167 family)
MFIKVKVKTNLKNEKIERLKDDSFAIGVKEKPERNLANNRVCEILADFFNIERNRVYIVKGHHAPNKIFFIKE